MLQKKYEDYLNQIYELYPDIEESSIRDILEFGLKKLYNYVREGNDIFLKVLSDYVFIGNPSKESLNQWNVSKLKEHNKRRRLFLDSKEEWDGYHYFGLTALENASFQTTPITIQMYKIRKECTIRKDISYIYRINLKYTVIPSKIPWREGREVSISQCELVENRVI